MSKNNNGDTFHKLQDSVLRDPKLTTSSQRIVYSYYLTRSRQSGRAWPAVSTVAFECGIGERTAQRAIQHLVKIGYLALVDAGGNGGKTYATNLYKVYKPKKGAAAASKARLTAEEQRRKDEAIFKRLAARLGVPAEVVQAQLTESKLTTDMRRAAPGSIKRVIARTALDKHIKQHQE